MAKKDKEEIEVKPKELEAVDIVKVKEQKSNPIGVVVFFVVILAAIFALPYVFDYFDSRNDGKDIKSPTDNNEQKQKEEEANEKGETDYANIATADLTFKGVKFQNFALKNEVDYYINFNVTAVDKSIDLNDGYFVEIYNSGQTLIERTKIYYSEKIEKNVKTNIKVPIKTNSFNNGVLIKIISKTPKEYPNVTLQKESDGTQIITCTNNNHIITYTFDDYKLKRINESETYYTTDNNYATILTEKKAATQSLNAEQGTTASLVENTGGFVTSVLTDLESATTSNLNKQYYYEKDTAAKTVKFELESMRFVCK